MVPKKRLYISHSLGDSIGSGTDSFECESTGSSSAISVSSLPHLLLHHHAHKNSPAATAVIEIHQEEPQPQNLSLKKPDRESRDDDSYKMTSSQQLPKLEPKEEQVDDEDDDAEDDDEEEVGLMEAALRLRRPYWEDQRLNSAVYHHHHAAAFMPNSPIKQQSSPSSRSHLSASCPSSPPVTAGSGAYRLSLDSRGGDHNGDSPPSSSSSPYLMSYQFQEKVEAELANLYKNGLGLCTSPEAATPISIRSFCIQDGNTYRCKVCNNAYTHPSNFHRHYVTTHLQRKSYPCSVCHKKFNRKDNMTAHLRAVHGWGGGGGLGGGGGVDGGVMTSSSAASSPSLSSSSLLPQGLPEPGIVN